MKKNLFHIFSLLLIGGTLVFSSCSDEWEQQLPENTQEEQQVLTLVATLPDADAESRLAYVSMGGKSFKTFWESDDQLVANGIPSNENYVYVFNLSEGAGTSIGTFECSGSINVNTNAWTVYYPGSKIQGEQDFFDFSYLGQVQSGNNNYDHIADYHSLRLKLGDGGDNYFGFATTYIDFSSESVEQSACMRFQLSGFETAIVPKKIELMYADPNGNYQSCFHTYNYLNGWWTGATPHGETTTALSLDLADFEATSNITAYMMMSNYPVSLQQGGKLRVYVTTEDGKRYYCDKEISADTTLEGGLMHRITCRSWTEEIVSTYDAMYYPEGNIFVLQEATAGNGTDIIIMGDGLSESHFANAN